MRYLAFFLMLLLSACTSPTPEQAPTEDPFTQIKDEKARGIIRTSIEHAGGLEAWRAMKRLAYTKNFSLLLEDGSIEKTFEQIHDYQLDSNKIDIVSIENGQTIRTVLENGEYQRTIDGDLADVPQTSLAKAVNTSTYVVGMPFKLLDPGVLIEYEGQTIMNDGRTVDVIRATYNADQHDNHSTTDVWKYYFDQEDRKIVGNWVQTSDHFSLLENVSFTRVNGILFNRARKSYRVDSLGQRLWLRADYLYENYIVE